MTAIGYKKAFIMILLTGKRQPAMELFVLQKGNLKNDLEQIRTLFNNF